MSETPGHPEVGSSSSDWIAIETVVAMCRESARTWRDRALREVKAAQREGRPALVRKRKCVGKGRPAWEIHRAFDRRLGAIQTKIDREEAAREALLERFAVAAVEEAYRKARWLRTWLKECETTKQAEAADRVAAQARRVEGEGYPLSLRTLQNWSHDYHRPRWIDGKPVGILGVEGLIDRRKIEPATDRSRRDPAAEAFFFENFRVRSKISVKTCHRLTLRESRRMGWAWPAGYAGTAKWLRENDPDPSETFLRREGEDAWRRRFMQYNEIDRSGLEPGQLFVCDHTPLDCWVMDRTDGKPFRPWLTAIEDERSRCIVGHWLGKTPNQDGILRAMLRAFRDYAIPEVARIDNGSDWASKLICSVSKKERIRLKRTVGPDWQEKIRNRELVTCVDPRFTGIAEELGIRIIYAQVRNPQSKGALERFFRTCEDNVARLQPTYCGNVPDNKPECLKDILKDGEHVPTLEEARQAMADFLEIYHRTPHSGADMDGKTPADMWATATRLRKAVTGELTLLCHARGVYKVHANGVRLKVGQSIVNYGRSHPALTRWAGKEVFVTLDPDDVSYVNAFTADRDSRKFIAAVPANERIPALTPVEQLREVMRDRNRERKVMRKARDSQEKHLKSTGQRLREMQREELAQLRATGTDDRRPNANIVPVKTAFANAVAPARSIGGSGIKGASGVAEDRKERDLSQAAKALWSGVGLAGKAPTRPRIDDSALAWPRTEETEATDSPEDDGEVVNNGTEAGSSIDPFTLLMSGSIGSSRRERSQ